MARPRKRFSYSTGRYGATIRIYEPRLGAPLRFDWRDADGRHRPEVEPAIVVRPSKESPEDPALVKKAESLCDAKAASLRLEPLREATSPGRLTLADAYAYYFDRRRDALPPSPQARKHHEDSRAFWLRELGADTPWDAIAPADVRGALKRLVKKGQVATAEKRLGNLKTLNGFLRDGMGFDALRDPTRTIKKAELSAGYTPARPRYSRDEIASLRSVMDAADPRFRLALNLAVDVGARSIQYRTARRSMLNPVLDMPLPPGHAPHGYLLLPGVKKQAPMLTYLSARTRAELDAAFTGYLAEREAAYQQDGTDYYLLPGGDDARGLTYKPLTYNALRSMLVDAEVKAEVPRRAKRALHGFRRAWADAINDAVGLDTTQHAGGWHNRETVETYLSPVKYGHLERARRAVDDAE